MVAMYAMELRPSVKSINLIVDSSTETEAIATSRGGELGVCVRAIDKGLGVYDPTPTFIGTDNKANALLASSQGAPARLRHAARRYHSFVQRVSSGEMRIGKILDTENPSDWLTKWVPNDKYDLSMEYAKNRRNRVDLASVRSGGKQSL